MLARGKMVYPLSWLILIRNYLKDTGRKCVSYRGLRSWIYRRGEYRDLEWHTVERVLRRLAEDGYVERVELGKRRVVFCPKGDLEWMIKNMLARYMGSG